MSGSVADFSANLLIFPLKNKKLHRFQLSSYITKSRLGQSFICIHIHGKESMPENVLSSLIG